ncbi:Epimerase family protein Mb2239 [Geodia barretti]|uniref:Epimerase family protein Mb2239 n=1 Tax=Geodia barretti TaxID=519541 RepID=A0AA35W6N1_GEOBA|nr:Epimerase family protein Mb2239 [Geodia barretti]
MHVLMTGSSGLVGSALTAFLEGSGQTVRRLRRAPSDAADSTSWNPSDGTFAPGAFDGIDAVVHLAGESIASGRWSAARKRRIRDSRVTGTQRLCEALLRLDEPPAVFVSASAIGFYGDRGAARLDESSAPGTGFLPHVCREWEAAAAPLRERGLRVVHLRIGIVLDESGGALKQMLRRSGSASAVSWGRAIST